MSEKSNIAPNADISDPAGNGRGRQNNSMKNQSTIESETRGGSCAPARGSAAEWPADLRVQQFPF